MAGRKLTDTTVVRNPNDQSVVTLLKGQTVPDWAEDQVGDHLLEAKASSGGKSGSSGSGQGGGGEPPRAGRGSGLEAWTAYAETLEIEVPDGASRDDVIELVDAHNGD